VTLPVTRTVAGHAFGAFRLFGCLGLVAAIAVALALAAARDLSLAVELALIGAAVATFLALSAVARGNLIYYHHEIAVLGLTAALAALLGAPVFGHLDATALGLGAFLACGRTGCLHVGCCHGRPARRGMVYEAEHARIGFPGYLVGVPLVPVQAIEAVGVASLVAAGAVVVAAGAAAGSGFALYVGGYALLRFPLELVRGDPGRRWWLGLSEAQWTSLAIAVGLAALPGAGLLHAVPAILLVPAAGLQASGVFGRPDGALDPRHVRELAGVLREAESRSSVSPPAPLATSLGVRVSYGSQHGCEHWSVSGTAPATGRALARVILWLRSPVGEAEIVRGPAGLLHVVIPR
jgi:prolipoprotein diacylglyceryltransferase